MKKRNILIILCCFFVLGCSNTEKKGYSRTKQDNVRQVSAIDKEFQDAMSEMEGLKATIEKHEKNYKLSTNYNRSILDKREALEAKQEIVIKSRELLNLANQGLDKEHIVRNVSGSKSTFESYNIFAKKKLDQYGK